LPSIEADGVGAEAGKKTLDVEEVTEMTVLARGWEFEKNLAGPVVEVDREQAAMGVEVVRSVVDGLRRVGL